MSKDCIRFSALLGIYGDIAPLTFHINQDQIW